jgi:iron complex outermembrane receptor protein
LLADDPSAALATYIPGYAPSRQKMSSTGESLRGRNALILLDGVPQTNPLRGGMREGYMADTAIIERVEVINGASAMQGMGATGGIVNYITRSPKAEGTTHSINVRLASQLRHDSLDWKTGYTLPSAASSSAASATTARAARSASKPYKATPWIRKAPTCSSRSARTSATSACS